MGGVSVDIGGGVVVTGGKGRGEVDIAVTCFRREGVRVLVDSDRAPFKEEKKSKKQDLKKTYVQDSKTKNRKGLQEVSQEDHRSGCYGVDPCYERGRRSV